MSKPEKIGERTFLLKGSPNTLFFIQEKTIFIIDPGHGSKRAKQIRSFAREYRETNVLLTHSHSDHVNIAEKVNANNIYAPIEEFSLIVDPRIRTMTTFGYPLNRGEILLFEPVKIEKILPLSQKALPSDIQMVELPGHSPAHKGFHIISDHVIYVGDSVFGEKVMERYGVLYHFDSLQAKDSLYKIVNLIDNDTIVVPSHGLVVKGNEARRLVEKNIEKIEVTIDIILNELVKPKSTSEVTRKLHDIFSLERTPSSLMLVETGVKGIISGLYLKGKIKPVIEDGILKWMIT